MKRETEKSIIAHFKDYRGKYQISIYFQAGRRGIEPFISGTHGSISGVFNRSFRNRRPYLEGAVRQERRPPRAWLKWQRPSIASTSESTTCGSKSGRHSYKAPGPFDESSSGSGGENAQRFRIRIKRRRVSWVKTKQELSRLQTKKAAWAKTVTVVNLGAALSRRRAQDVDRRHGSAGQCR